MTPETWVAIISALTALVTAIAALISAIRGRSVINKEIKPAITEIANHNHDAGGLEKGGLCPSASAAVTTIMAEGGIHLSRCARTMLREGSDAKPGGSAKDNLTACTELPPNLSGLRDCPTA